MPLSDNDMLRTGFCQLLSCRTSYEDGKHRFHKNSGHNLAVHWHGVSWSSDVFNDLIATPRYDSQSLADERSWLWLRVTVDQFGKNLPSGTRTQHICFVPDVHPGSSCDVDSRSRLYRGENKIASFALIILLTTVKAIEDGLAQRTHHRSLCIFHRVEFYWGAMWGWDCSPGNNLIKRFHIGSRGGWNETRFARFSTHRWTHTVL